MPMAMRRNMAPLLDILRETSNMPHFLQVHEGFFRQKLFFRFAMVRIVDAAIHWTDSRTLRFVVKTHTFCALV